MSKTEAEVYHTELHLRYLKCMQLYNKLESTYDRAAKAKALKECVSEFEAFIQDLETEGVFSRNETESDISEEFYPLLLSYYYLAEATGRITPDPEQQSAEKNRDQVKESTFRLRVLKRQRELLLVFLGVLSDYKLLTRLERGQITYMNNKYIDTVFKDAKAKADFQKQESEENQAIEVEDVTSFSGKLKHATRVLTEEDEKSGEDTPLKEYETLKKNIFAFRTYKCETMRECFRIKGTLDPLLKGLIETAEKAGYVGNKANGSQNAARFDRDTMKKLFALQVSTAKQEAIRTLDAINEEVEILTFMIGNPELCAEIQRERENAQLKKSNKQPNLLSLTKEQVDKLPAGKKIPLDSLELMKVQGTASSNVKTNEKFNFKDVDLVYGGGNPDGAGPWGNTNNFSDTKFVTTKTETFVPGQVEEEGDEEKERSDMSDDEQIKKDREWDDYKDWNPRGWGNRQRMM